MVVVWMWGEVTSQALIVVGHLAEVLFWSFSDVCCSVMVTGAM